MRFALPKRNLIKMTKRTLSFLRIFLRIFFFILFFYFLMRASEGATLLITGKTRILFSLLLFVFLIFFLKYAFNHKYVKKFRKVCPDPIILFFNYFFVYLLRMYYLSDVGLGLTWLFPKIWSMVSGEGSHFLFRALLAHRAQAQ